MARGLRRNPLSRGGGVPTPLHSRRLTHPCRQLTVGLLAHPADLGVTLVEDAADRLLAPLEVVLGLGHDLAGLGVGPVETLLGVRSGLLEQRRGLGGRLLLVDRGGPDHPFGLDLGFLAMPGGCGSRLLQQGGPRRLLLLVALGEVRVHLLDVGPEGGVPLGLVGGIPSHGGVVVTLGAGPQRLGTGVGVVEQGRGLGTG